MAEVLLKEFLGELAKQRYDFAHYNCFHMLNDWVMRVTGRDSMAEYRTRCRNKREAWTFLKAGGGTAAILSAGLAALGASVVDEPAAGDVALVLAPIENGGCVTWGDTCAICVGAGMFAVLTSDLGLVIAPMTLVKAWSLAPIAAGRD